MQLNHTVSTVRVIHSITLLECVQKFVQNTFFSALAHHDIGMLITTVEDLDVVDVNLA